MTIPKHLAILSILSAFSFDSAVEAQARAA